MKDDEDHEADTADVAEHELAAQLTAAVADRRIGVVGHDGLPRRPQFLCEASSSQFRLIEGHDEPSRCAIIHRIDPSPRCITARRMKFNATSIESTAVDPPNIPREWLEEFEAAARRPLKTRFRYAFIKTYKPVLDDARFRAFDTTADYRRWCEENLPSWLGYGRV